MNDFLKYALLRALERNDLSLTVVWMLTDQDGRSDGRRLRYLEQPELFRQVDPPLFDALKQIVTTRGRSVRSIEIGRILPRAAYVASDLSDDAGARRRYFDQVWEVSTGRELLFFDPDNGLSVASVTKGKRASSKYLYPDELRDAYARGHSTAIYQHFPRRPREPFIREILQSVESVTGCPRALAIATSHVAFLVAPQPEHSLLLLERLQEFARNTRAFAALVNEPGDYIQRAP